MRYSTVVQIYLGWATEYVREVTINSGLAYPYNY